MGSSISSGLSSAPIPTKERRGEESLIYVVWRLETVSVDYLSAFSRLSLFLIRGELTAAAVPQQLSRGQERILPSSFRGRTRRCCQKSKFETGWVTRVTNRNCGPPRSVSSWRANRTCTSTHIFQESTSTARRVSVSLPCSNVSVLYKKTVWLGSE